MSVKDGDHKRYGKKSRPGIHQHILDHEVPGNVDIRPGKKKKQGQAEQPVDDIDSPEILMAQLGVFQGFSCRLLKEVNNMILTTWIPIGNTLISGWQ